MMNRNSGRSFEGEENFLQFDPIGQGPAPPMEQADQLEQPVEAVPQFLAIHFLFVLDHVGEGEVEVLAVGVNYLIDHAQILHLGNVVQDGRNKLLLLALGR